MPLRQPRRGRHVDLPTQQRRVRHLRSISGRNLSLDGFSGLLDSYFSLHQPSFTSEAFYKSEIIRNSLNPTWKSFDVALINNLTPSFSCLVVRVFARRTGSNFSLVIEWYIDLRALVYVGDHLFSDKAHYSRNQLIFGMFEGYYTAPVDEKLSQRVLAASLQTPCLIFERSLVKQSYSKAWLVGAHQEAQEMLAKQHYAMESMRKKIEGRLHDAERRAKLANLCEQTRSRLTHLEDELHRQQTCLHAEHLELNQTQQVLEERERDLSQRHEQLCRRQQDMEDGQCDLEGRRELLSRWTIALQRRRCTMLKGLADIYPITSLSRSEHGILGVRLPHSEAFAGHPDEDIATGFGFATHLLVMISLIMQLPLRYKLVHRGSRSLVVDELSEATAVLETKRECPLYPRQRADRDDYFKYAVFLLNKNLSQIRLYCDLMTTDGRCTLLNLKRLLDRFLPSDEDLLQAPNSASRLSILSQSGALSGDILTKGHHRQSSDPIVLSPQSASSGTLQQRPFSSAASSPLLGRVPVAFASDQFSSDQNFDGRK